jgi:hypothetical protein
VDPCALLTSAEVTQLKVDKGTPDTAYDQDHSAICQWADYESTPDNAWTAGVELRHSAEEALGGAGAQVVQVGGFPAVQTASGIGDNSDNCILLVDVAPGQRLSVAYINQRKDFPGINHEVACQQADKAAELMVANLRSLAH